MNEAPRGHGRDSLDASIDEAARRMVTGSMPPPLARAVVSAIEGRETSPWRMRRWRLALGTASLTVSVAVASLVWTLGEREARHSSVPAVALVPSAAADDPIAVERRALSGQGLLDGWVLPGPVKVRLVSVAPVVIPAVKVAPVEVGRVEVAAVTVRAQ
jgi:hypothetical protein